MHGTAWCKSGRTHICVSSLTLIRFYCCSDRKKAWMEILQTSTMWERASDLFLFSKVFKRNLIWSLGRQMDKLSFQWWPGCFGCKRFQIGFVVGILWVFLSFSWCISHVSLHLAQCKPSSSSSQALASAQPGPSSLLERARVVQTLLTVPVNETFAWPWTRWELWPSYWK